MLNSLNKLIMYTFLVILLAYLMSCYTAFGYPMKGQEEKTHVQKNEKKFPNGTIVGKYSYRDKDGNPIHVRYYADGSSYGVELKSVKVFGSKPDNSKEAINLAMTPEPYEEAINEANSFISNSFVKNKSFTPFQVINEVPEETSKSKKQNADYEIFLENDIRPSQDCKKEKVRIYTDKSKRKVRKADDENNFFCERF